MNAKRIAEIARGLTQIRGGAIYALIACAALALTLYSCSQPPARQQPTPLPPTPAIVAASPVPATPTPQPTSGQRQPTPLPTPTPTPTPVPAYVPLLSDAQFTRIAAGKWHVCGLQADGTALCWGRNISDSLKMSGALHIDGAIACWGQNDSGQASPPKGSFDEIAAGHFHACALDDSTLICWGNGFPDGSETIQGIPPLLAIQAGGNFTCGLTPDADIACLNNGDKKLDITPGPFTDIGVGLRHSCAIKTNGSVFCSGKHYSQRSQPPPTKFVQISSGWYHTCGITKTSDIECWGSGVRGAPGERLSAPESEFTAISIGWHNSCILNLNGHAVCWQQSDVQNPSELEAFGGVRFDQPVELFPLPDGRLAGVERKGLIAACFDEPNAAAPPKTMLDLTDETVCCEDESGMFSAALDPQFDKFSFLYVYYRVVSEHAYGENMPGLASRLARFRH